MPEAMLPDTGQFNWRDLHKIAKHQLQISTARCVCGWFDHEYKGEDCPRCNRSLTELTEWWREMDDRFWGMSRDELKEDFDTWSVLNAEIVL